MDEALGIESIKIEDTLDWCIYASDRCLSDLSLPFGGFVFSFELKSFVSHGFLAHGNTNPTCSEAILNFTFFNAQSYTILSAAFFYHLHALIRNALAGSKNPPKLFPKLILSIQEDWEQRIVWSVCKLKQLFESMCLSPINLWNSYTEGSAFLLLYTNSKGGT